MPTPNFNEKADNQYMSKYEDTLQRFVVRARRVAAHSMVANPDALEAFAKGSMTISGVLGSSEMRITRALPESEEVFESLAARLRPLTLRGEPVHFENVLSALREAVADHDSVGDNELSELDSVSKSWSTIDLQGSQVLGYAVQQSNADGTNATDFVSDTQLAAAWLYADLVHADAQGQKKKALDFPMRERYAAATRYFSHVALLTIRTLRLVERLQEFDVIQVPESAWNEDVVVTETALVEEATTYVAAIGTSAPDLTTQPILSADWTQLSATSMQGLVPGKRADVILFSEGAEIERLPAAIVAHHEADGATHIKVLVADALYVDLDIRSSTQDLSMSFSMPEGNNSIALRVLRVNKSLAAATHMTLLLEQIGAIEKVELPVIDRGAPWDEWIEYVGDICAIEKMTGTPLETVSRCTPEQRIFVRIIRQLREGLFAKSTAERLQATTLSDESPDHVFLPEDVVSIGDITLTVPAHQRWHPLMTTSRIERVEVDGASAVLWEVRAPEGERFFARMVTDELAPPADTTWSPVPWGLTGIPE